jgi:proton-translocating NADH-quinone oxidoreductase chain L
MGQAHRLQGSEVSDHDAHDAHGHGLDDDEDPKVPHLSTGAKASAYVAMIFMAFACVYSWVLLFTSASGSVPMPEGGVQVLSYDWASFGGITYTLAFHLDQLGIAMLVVVTTISLLVQFYSQGYMDNSAGYARFYSYLSLFVFSMLVIIFAQNFLVIFIGWELVGLSSYLLIGFWINKKAKPEEQRPSPSSAALQAFVMNRIGDVGFIIGIMTLFAITGTFDFVGIHDFLANNHVDTTVLTIAMILVFCGAIGKSAQVPLHVWLPSAMEGPTPVSALIHAATMVAAGVYMVARTAPLFAAAGPGAFEVVAWIGGITAFFAATIALVQSDFKRVLAFSTISQLGYMFVGLGVGGPCLAEVSHGVAEASHGVAEAACYGVGPGMFHLFTHAFFKALLFLGAGSVLHALHHAFHREVQNMRFMGGLASRMPITAITWFIAVLAISGFPGFSGFYSKETIIGLTFEEKDWGLYALTLITAGLTAFYMLRAFILAFGGKGGKLGGLWGGPYRGQGEVHESPKTVTIPLCILAVFSIFAGYWTGFFRYVQPDAPNLDIARLFSLPDTWVGVAVSLVGLTVAYGLYARVDFSEIDAVVQSNPVLRTIHRILYNRYYIDDFYNWLTKYIFLGMATLAQLFDTYVVDGAVNGTAWLVNGLGGRLRRVETGRVQSYMIGFFGGLAVIGLLVFVFGWSPLAPYLPTFGLYLLEHWQLTSSLLALILILAVIGKIELGRIRKLHDTSK